MVRSAAAFTALMLAAVSPLTSVSAPPPGSLGAYFDPAGSQATLEIPFTPPVIEFDVYFVAFGIPSDIGAYEFGLLVSKQQNETVYLIGPQLPDGLMQSCDDLDYPERAICAGTFPYCLPTADTLVLAQWHVITTTPLRGATFCVIPTTVPRGETSPVWLPCGALDQPQAFLPAYDGCATVNAVVPLRSQDWSAVKALYGF